MKITFVAFGQEHLSISLLSAIAKNMGHQVNLAYSASLFNDRFMPRSGLLSKVFNDSGNIIRTLENTQPDIIAFSALSATFRQLLEVAAYAKKNIPKALTVFGGVHPSAAPQQVIAEEAIDYIVLGEGEEAFKQLLEHIARNDFESPIPNTWFKNQQQELIKGESLACYQSLDSLPMVDKSIWLPYLNISHLYTAMASRGCPFKCSFCFNHHFRSIAGQGAGKYVRLRSPAHLMDELIFAKNTYHIKYIDFVDDIFTMDKNWLKAFLSRYRSEIGLPFHCFVHASFFDEETAMLLKEGGCKWVQIGIQSLDEHYKNNTLHRHETNQQLQHALYLMKKYKLRSKFDYILALPGEDINAQQLAVDFFRKHTPVMLETYWATFFPATEMLHYALNHGYITKEIYNDIMSAKTPDIYRKPNQYISQTQAKLLNNYRFLFKLYTILPYALRKRTGLRTVAFIPHGIKNFLYSIISLSISLCTHEPRIKSMLRHTARQMFRIIKNKLFS